MLPAMGVRVECCSWGDARGCPPQNCEAPFLSPTGAHICTHPQSYLHPRGLRAKLVKQTCLWESALRRSGQDQVDPQQPGGGGGLGGV